VYDRAIARRRRVVARRSVKLANNVNLFGLYTYDCIPRRRSSTMYTIAASSTDEPT